MNTEATTSLRERWETVLAQKPKIRIRDAAAELGVSEAELLATGCGDNVTRLAGDWSRLIKDLPTVGRVMCLTRNEHAVHERYGEFRQVDFFHGMGQVVGPDIDLRLFMSHWHHGFAVTDQTSEGERQSFQFFNAAGEAVHKVFLQKESNYGAYGVILNKFRSPDQGTDVAIIANPPAAPEIPDAEIDIEGFRNAWRELKDTHAFFVILQKFRVGRVQALRLAPEGFARRVGGGSVRRMLESAASSDLPIMVFIGNRGCLQIHTGPVKNIKMFGAEWLNVLDEEFNMHLRDTAVSSVWIVRKPTVDGVVTSLEVFDAEGNNLALFFGKRKPGETEDRGWRGLLETLE
jgi:putative hemin transport protein